MEKGKSANKKKMVDYRKIVFYTTRSVLGGLVAFPLITSVYLMAKEPPADAKQAEESHKQEKSFGIALFILYGVLLLLTYYRMTRDKNQ